MVLYITVQNYYSIKLSQLINNENPCFTLIAQVFTLGNVIDNYRFFPK